MRDGFGKVRDAANPSMRGFFSVCIGKIIYFFGKLIVAPGVIFVTFGGMAMSVR